MDIASFSVSIDRTPEANQPRLEADRWAFRSNGLALRGSVTLGETRASHMAPAVVPASRNPLGAGWRIGWVQVNVQEWSWALYSNSRRADAVLLEWPLYTAMDREDDSSSLEIFCSKKAPFYTTLADNQTGNIAFNDSPPNEFALTLSGADRDLTLSSIGLRLSFVCALAARAPDDALFVLKWVPWYVQWSYDFSPGGIMKRLPGCDANAGPVNLGPAPEILVKALAAGGLASNEIAIRQAGKRTPVKASMIDMQLRRLRVRG